VRIREASTRKGLVVDRSAIGQIEKGRVILKGETKANRNGGEERGERFERKRLEKLKL